MPTVAESLIRDLGRVSEWCDLWRMKVNASKINTMIVLRSRTMQSTRINYWWNCTEGVLWPCYIGSDIWFQDDLREASSLSFQSSFSKICYLEEVLVSVHERSLLGRCFRGFVLPFLEYCSAVWCSAAETHLKLLDRAVSGARFLTKGVFECGIAHHRSVAVLCMLNKIRCNPVHPLNGALPGPYVPVRVTRVALVALVAEPRSTAGLLFPSQCPSGTILL